MKLYYFFILSILFIGCSETNINQMQNEPFIITRSASQASLAPVPINAKILLNISTDLNESSINSDSIYIKSSTNNTVPANIRYQQKIITITPKVYLQPNTNYTIYVTTAVASSTGKHLSKDTNISFTSAGSLPDLNAPIYINTNVAYPVQPNSIYYFQFDEAISPLSVTADMLQITDIVNDYNISSSVTVSGSLLIFTPNEDLKDANTLKNDIGYKIILTLDNRIQDLSGNAMASSQVDLSANIVSSNVYLSQTAPLQAETYTTLQKITTLYSLQNNLYVGSEKGLVALNFDFMTSHFSKRGSLSFNDVGSVYSILEDSLNNRLYLGTSKGMYIVNSVDKNNLTIINQYLTSAPVYNIQQEGDHLYLAATLQGIVELNISNETAIQKVLAIPTSGIAFDIYVKEDQIFIADYNNSMPIHDLDGNVSALFPPSIIGRIKGIINNNNTVGQFLINTGVGGVQAWDNGLQYITDKHRLPSYITKVEVANSFIYANLASLGVFVYSASDYTDINRSLLIPTPYINIETFTYMEDSTGTNKYLILADKSGKIYSSKLP